MGSEYPVSPLHAKHQYNQYNDPENLWTECLQRYYSLAHDQISEARVYLLSYIPAVVDHRGGMPCHGTFLLHQVCQADREHI